MRGLPVVLLLGSIAFTFGCADATIRKVPNRSDYAVWTDEMQREVDGLCGLRFYRSRPYVVVKEPFLVAQESYLVDGLVTADGQHALLIPQQTRDKEKITDELYHYGLQEGLVHDTRTQLKVELASVFNAASTTLQGDQPETTTPQPGARPRPGASPRPGDRPQPGASPTPGAAPGGPVEGAENESAGDSGRPTPEAGGPVTADTSGAGVVTSEEPPVDDSADETVASSPTGRASLRLATHLTGIAHKNLGTKFDILYLPDFEEQYVIDPRANLGDLNLQLTQGPGGELLAMGMQVDNSAITRPLVDLYTQAVQKAGSSIVGDIGGAPTAGAAPKATIRDGTGAAETAPGRVVTLRVHVMKYASPGIYPILKASEVLENRRCTRDLCRSPTCSGSGSCTTCRGGIRHDAGLGHSHIVPVYPYSRVAYQIHRKVVIEAALTGAPQDQGAQSQSFLRSLQRRSSFRASGRTPGRGLRAASMATAPAATSNEDIEAMINAVLLACPQTKCLKVRIVSRKPESGPRSELEDLDIQFSGRDGAPVEQCTRAINQALALIRSRLDFPSQMSLGITFGKFGS